MRMLIVACLLLLVHQTFSAETGEEMDITLLTETQITEVVGREIEDIEPTEIRMPKYPYGSGLHMVLGNAITWMVNHLNTAEGWSLTGYAKMNLDKDFRRARWKFGIINGELSVFDYDPYWNKMMVKDTPRSPNQSVIFGLCWQKEF